MKYLEYLLRKAFDFKEGELKTGLIGMALFALVFSSYSMLRPIRDTMGIAGGVKNLQWLFLATFAATFIVQIPYAKAVSYFQKRLILPVVYGFFAANLLLFALFIDEGTGQAWLGRVFYVWCAVFNLLVISLGWSLMNDALSSSQAKRLFAFIATGSSAGSIIGPALTMVLVTRIGQRPLLLVSAGLLLAAAALSQAVIRLRGKDDEEEKRPIRGSVWAGMTATFGSSYLRQIALFIVLSSTVNTFLYFELMNSVAAEFADKEEQTVVFSAIDFCVNSGSIVLQLFVTGRVAQRYGLMPLLVMVPAACVFGFIALCIWPGFAAAAVTMALRRIGQYGFVRPGREMLFSMVGEEDKYKAKNFLDTVVYRGGDVISAFIARGLDVLGGGVASALGGVAASGIWVVNSACLGRLNQRLAGRFATTKEKKKNDY
jgi:AAA family ATP:ADP antiporter